MLWNLRAARLLAIDCHRDVGRREIGSGWQRQRRSGRALPFFLLLTLFGIESAGVSRSTASAASSNTAGATFVVTPAAPPAAPLFTPDGPTDSRAPSSRARASEDQGQAEFLLSHREQHGRVERATQHAPGVFRADDWIKRA